MGIVDVMFVFIFIVRETSAFWHFNKRTDSMYGYRLCWRKLSYFPSNENESILLPSPSDSLLIPNLCFDFLVFFVFFVFFLLPNWSSWRYLSDLLVAETEKRKLIKFLHAT